MPSSGILAVDVGALSTRKAVVKSNASFGSTRSVAVKLKDGVITLTSFSRFAQFGCCRQKKRCNRQFSNVSDLWCCHR